MEDVDLVEHAAHIYTSPRRDTGMKRWVDLGVPLFRQTYWQTIVATSPNKTRASRGKGRACRPSPYPPRS